MLRSHRRDSGLIDINHRFNDNPIRSGPGLGLGLFFKHILQLFFGGFPGYKHSSGRADGGENVGPIGGGFLVNPDAGHVDLNCFFGQLKVRQR